MTATCFRRLLAPALLLALLVPQAAHAIPAFARKYGVSCAMCHNPPPRLTPFGEQFAANGFELMPGEPPRDTIATGDDRLRLLRALNFAFRFDAFVQAQTDATHVDLQTPFGLKLLSGGAIADRISYYLYFFMTERGEVAGLEDVYLQFTDVAGSGVNAIVGQFQVSDPLFKRELRLPVEDYQAYRVRVGRARPDLTYDRGLMLTGSPWEGGDLTLMVVNGEGLSPASERRLYDRDTGKNVALRYSHELGPLRLGAFGYYGVQEAEGRSDEVAMFGPDATLQLGRGLELNLQYLRRRDDNPFFVEVEQETTVDAGFAELVWAPRGPMGRWYFSALYNRVQADAPVISLRLGEQDDDPGFLRRYETVAAGAHYLLERNVRLLAELGWDLHREEGRFTTGVVAAW